MRGWSDLPEKTGARIALFSLLFFGTMMFWQWEAMLVSYLATRTTVLPFDGLAGLMSSSDFRILTLYESSQEDLFKVSKNPLWQSAWIDRVQPHREEHKDFTNQELIGKLANEPKSAVFINYYSAM